MEASHITLLVIIQGYQIFTTKKLCGLWKNFGLTDFFKSTGTGALQIAPDSSTFSVFSSSNYRRHLIKPDIIGTVIQKIESELLNKYRRAEVG